MAKKFNAFKEAKKIKKMHKSWDWQYCIDVASQRHKKKLGTAKKKSNTRQTGSSNKKRDMERSARPPGARVPRGGKSVTYYERRKNRSDVPGQLTGLTIPQLKLRARKLIKDKLGTELLKRELEKGKRAKKKINLRVRQLKTALNKFS